MHTDSELYEVLWDIREYAEGSCVCLQKILAELKKHGKCRSLSYTPGKYVPGAWPSNMSVLLQHILERRVGLLEFAQVEGYTLSEMRRVKGIGEHLAKELQDLMAQQGLHFRGEKTS